MKNKQIKIFSENIEAVLTRDTYIIENKLPHKVSSLYQTKAIEGVNG